MHVCKHVCVCVCEEASNWLAACSPAAGKLPTKLQAMHPGKLPTQLQAMQPVHPRDPVIPAPRWLGVKATG